MAGPVVGLGESLCARLIPVIAPLLEAIPNEAGQEISVPVRSIYTMERARWPLVTTRVILGDVHLGAGGNILGNRAAIRGPADQVWTLTFGGPPTGGYFTLSFPVVGSVTTSHITYSMTAATTADAIQAALDALVTMGVGTTIVQAVDSTHITIRATGMLAGRLLDNVVADGTGLTGNNPSVSAAISTRGGDDQSRLRGMRVPGSQLVLDILARSDPERYFIADALAGGLLADYMVLPSGQVQESAVITALRLQGLVVTAVRRPQFPAPVLGEGRPEGQSYHASLVVEGDAWFTWSTPGVVLNVDGAPISQEPDADPYSPEVVDHLQSFWTLHAPS